jgi:hypothetical protein
MLRKKVAIIGGEYSVNWVYFPSKKERMEDSKFRRGIL